MIKFKQFIEKKKENKEQKVKQEKGMPILFAGINKRQAPKNLSEALSYGQKLEAKDKKIHNSPTGDEAYKQHVKLGDHYHFDPKHLKAVKSYTSSSSHLNNHLYEKEKKELGLEHDKADAKGNVSITKHVNAMKEALSSHTTPEHMHVFTGVAADPRKYFDNDSKKTHTIVRMPAFTSTSLQKKVADHFTHGTGTVGKKIQHHLLRIRVPKGSHGAYVGHHSHYEHEHEFILHPGAHLKISHKPYHTESNSWSQTHFYDAELVHDGVKK